MATTKAFRTKWVKALRSGKFAQGEGFLMKNARYCCLGVACVVAGVPLPHVVKDRSVGSYDRLNAATGLTASQSHSLAHMNDNGQSFEQIADFIETHLGSKASTP